MDCNTCGILSIISSSLGNIGQNSSVKASYCITKILSRHGSISEIEGFENCVANNKARNIFQPASHGFECLKIVRNPLFTHQVRSSQCISLDPGD